MESLPASTPPKTGRAAALGLSGGMLLGAIYLSVRAVMLMRQECAPGLLAEDCTLEQSIAAEMSNFFFFFAAGLVLVGAGLYLLFRKPKEQP